MIFPGKLTNVLLLVLLAAQGKTRRAFDRCTHKAKNGIMLLALHVLLLLIYIARKQFITLLVTHVLSYLK